MSNRKNKQEELFPRELATAAMKAVAESTADARKLTKSFSPNEIEEILAKRNSGGKLEPVETAAIRTKYRQIKHQIKELEHGNIEIVRKTNAIFTFSEVLMQTPLMRT